jgi:hypothetical protein
MVNRMKNLDVINLTLHIADNSCNRIALTAENEFLSWEIKDIDTIEQSETVSTKLKLLAEIYDKTKEAQEIIKQCRTLSRILNGITGI